MFIEFIVMRKVFSGLAEREAGSGRWLLGLRRTLEMVACAEVLDLFHVVSILGT